MHVTPNINIAAENLTTVHRGMAEDRENGSPCEEAEQFEVLDEVGEVEDWDGEFPDDDDEQVGDAEEKDVSDSVLQSNKKQETVATEKEPVCVKPSSVKNNNSSAADKDNKEQSETSLNKVPSPIKDIKSEPSVSKEVKSKEASSSKDAKSKESSSSKDAKSKESLSSKDAKSKESSSGKDAKSKESSSVKDAKSKESSSGKDAKSKESSSGKDVKSKESSSCKDAKSKESSSGKDAKSKESTSKDPRSKVPSTGKDKTSGKDEKSSKTSEDKKTETKDSESLQKSTGSAVKRKSNISVAQKPEAKKIKLSSGKEDKRGPDVKEIEVISTDSSEEHQLRKKNFVDAMIFVSNELKRERDYRRWVEKERKDGMAFPVFDIDPPTEPILFSCCQLITGYENDSTKLCLGFARTLEVVRFSTYEEKYVPEVRSTVKAFEEMVQGCSKPLYDPVARQGYWYSVAVIANSKGNTLLRVNIYAADQQEGEVRSAEAKDILVKYFSSERAGDCHVSSIYLRLVFAKNYSGPEKGYSERKAASCIMGNKFIVETIGGMKVNLYPWSFFSTGTVAMTALCEQMLKVLLQESCKNVVELGCGTGIVGQFLAKHCESVLGVDTAGCIAEAKVNAEENHLSNCTYFDKNTQDIWKTLGHTLRGKGSVMVIVNALYFDYLVEYPVISWLTRSNKVCRVVYVKMTKTMLKAPKSRVAFLCTTSRELKKRHDDPMPYFPLYALPVNLGTEVFAAVFVLQHVESNFINELYERRKKYKIKSIHIANSTSSRCREEDNSREETKHRSTSSATKRILSKSKHNDKNANGNITDVKNVARNRSFSDARGPARRDVDTGRTRASRREELPSSRNVRVNKDGMLTTRIDASRHDGTLPPRDLRNMLQTRLGYKHIGDLLDKLISPREIQDLRTVLRRKRMYAERHVNVPDDFRGKRFVDEIICNRNRNLLDTVFVNNIIPPGTEDSRQILQEKDMMVENIARNRNERSREFYGRGQVGIYENNDLQSSIEKNRSTHMNEGKDSFRDSSRLPRDAETWGEARMRVNLRDELSSGRNLYLPDVRGKLHSRNDEPEAFPLVKDSALFERGLDSKISIRDERRKVMLANIQDMRSIYADLRSSGPGRSFDDAELGRRKLRTDDIASGTKTDVRGINIRAGGWKARDDRRNMESIHDSFSKFDAYLSNVKSSMKDFQHSWKYKPEFNQSFPNAGTKSELRVLLPNSKLQVTGDIPRENPYRDDKPNYFGEGDKSSKAGWFALNERRPDVGNAERNRAIFGPVYNRIMLDETDRNRIHIDGSKRNRVVGESVSERRIFGGPERIGASVDGPDNTNRNVFVKAEDRKLQVFETEDRNKQVFSEPNRNSVMFGGSEAKKRPLYDDAEDRNRSVYGELENRKRQMYGEPHDRTRQIGDRKRSVYGRPENGSGYMFSKTDDRNLPVTERSRPFVEEIGRYRPTVEETERNRLRERENVLLGVAYRYK